MENEHILPNTLVPEDIRLKVYKEAIDIIKQGELKYCLGGFDLCLLLPCILWDLDSFLNDTPLGETWWDVDTINQFPEITKLVSTTGSLDRIDADQLRIQCLEEAIKQLTK